MRRSSFSLKWLEAFQAVARHGSIRAAAEELTLSVSTVSYHLTCLEDAIGAPLMDHSKRPMRLTAQGETLLGRVDEALQLLRRGVSELWSDDFATLARHFRLAMVEDFDTDASPALAAQLAQALPLCDFSMMSRPSHEIVDLLQSEEIDVGVATSAEVDLPGLAQEPLLRDPYVLVTPANTIEPPSAIDQLVALSERLPFLRYSKKQLIGRRVEAQVRRLNLRLEGRIAFESTHAIMAMVAANRGWSITTPLTFARARRYSDQVQLSRFPGGAFTRHISLYRRDTFPSELHQMLSQTLRTSIQTSVVDAVTSRQPWLADEFRLIPVDSV